MANPDLKTVMKIKGCKDNRKLQDILTRIYLKGFADAQDAVVDSKERFLHIKKNTQYEFTCPECGATAFLDMEDLLKQQEGDQNGTKEES